MTDVFFATIILIMLSSIMIIIRIINGPTLFDRFLAANSLNSKINILLVLLASFRYNQCFVDIAFIYAFTSYIAIYGVLRFIRNKNLGGEA